MKFLSNISLAMKFWLIVGLFSVGIGIVAWSGLLSAARLGQNMTQVSKGQVPRLQVIAEIGVQARTMRTRHFQFLAATAPDRRAKLWGEIQESDESTEKAIQDYAKLATDPADKENAKQLEIFWRSYADGAKPLQSVLEKQGETAAFTIVDKTIRPRFVDDFIPLLEKMGSWNKAEAARLDKEGNELQTKARTLIGGMMFVCIAIGIALAAITVRAIVRSANVLMSSLDGLQKNEMQGLTDAMGALENADLTLSVHSNSKPIEVEGKDEFAKMSTVFNQLQSQVRDAVISYDAARRAMSALVSDVRENADEVSNASRVVADTTDQSGRSATDIATGSERLARSATEAAEAMERFRQAIDEIEMVSQDQAAVVEQADASLMTARGALDLVATASTKMAEVAQQGGQAVSETIGSMESIRDQVEATADRVRDLDEKGQQIGQIVSTIEAIAAQTNLLALNAAIEAARAGDHGRGFAVVADEVRQLAEQSGAATKEIGALIESVRETVSKTVKAIELAQECVEIGTGQSQTAGGSLSEIVTSAEAVASQLSDMTTASSELEAAMRRVSESTTRTANLSATVARDTQSISEAIESVASISQEAAAGAEEMSASTEEVAASASELNTLASKLRGMVTSFEVEERNEVRLKVA